MYILCDLQDCSFNSAFNTYIELLDTLRMSSHAATAVQKLPTLSTLEFFSKLPAEPEDMKVQRSRTIRRGMHHLQ
jgi:hypothetical protein